MAGLSETQRAEVRIMITEGLTLLSQEQQAQLTKVRQELVDAGAQFETQNNEFRSLQTAYAQQIEAKQQRLVEHLEYAEKQKAEIGDKLDAEFGQKQEQINRIMHEIAAKQADSEAIRGAIEVTINRAQENLQQQGVQTKREAEAMVYQLRQDVTTESQVVRKEVVDLSGRVTAITQIIESGAGASGQGSNFGAKILKRSLIDPREMKMPVFPENPSQVDAFKRWYREVAKHIQRHGYGHAEVLFSALRGYDRPLVTPDEIGELMDKATEYPNAGVRFRDAWDWPALNGELWDALEHLMKDRHEDCLESVEPGQGFEVVAQAQTQI